MDQGQRKKPHQHPLQGKEPRGTKDSVADLLANIKGMAKADPVGAGNLDVRLKHAAFDNDYVVDSIWWQALEKRHEWDRIRNLPLAPSLRHALFLCAVNHGLAAAIAMLESIDAVAENEAKAQAGLESEVETDAPEPTRITAKVAEKAQAQVELEVHVVQEEAQVQDGLPVVQAPRVIARKRTPGTVVKPRDYDFGERTLRYTKYQFYLLYRQPWVKKVIRRARDNRPDVA